MGATSAVRRHPQDQIEVRGQFDAPVGEAQRAAHRGKVLVVVERRFGGIERVSALGRCRFQPRGANGRSSIIIYTKFLQIEVDKSQ